MLFDGDKAGVNATLRGIDIILTAGLNVNVCSFPNGEDPDSYSQDKSFEEIEMMIENLEDEDISINDAENYYKKSLDIIFNIESYLKKAKSTIKKYEQ